MSRLNLHTRILLLAVGIVGIVSLFGLGVVIHDRIQSNERRFHDDATTLASALMPLLQNALVAGDLATVQQTLDPLVQQGTLNNAAILSNRERIVETLPPPTPAQLAPQWFRQAIGEQTLGHDAAIEVGGVSYGVLRLEMNNGNEIDDLWRSSVHFVLVGLLFLGVIVALLHFALAHGLRPLSRLREGAERIGSGDWEHRIPPIEVPEIANVGEAFNHMADEIVRHRAELTKARDSAEAASHAKSEFLASMSHELRTPLNAILGFSQLFGMNPDLPPSAKEHAAEIERAGQHLLSLINDVIDLARIESGRLEFSFEAVPVRDIMHECRALIAPIADKYSVDLLEDRCHCNIERVSVRADYVRLRQVVINLLSNAVKYNRPLGTVQLYCHLHEERVRIVVSDTGPGIPADKQVRLFNAFDRLGEERGNKEGTGIGLVITRRMTEAMGGIIGFESEVGQGSTFWVEFPVMPGAPVTEAETAELSAACCTPGAAPPRRKALYIEDNPMNVRLMQQIFGKCQRLELDSAPTAEIGIEMACNNPPAVILMDINLPGMSGYEALEKLKNDPRSASIPVLAVSSNAMKGDIARGLEAGFLAYFPKPIDIPALLLKLDELVERIDQQESRAK